MRKLYCSALALPCLVFGFSLIPEFSQAQSYTPMYKPQAVKPNTWVCLDQFNEPIPYAYWEVLTGPGCPKCRAVPCAC